MNNDIATYDKVFEDLDANRIIVKGVLSSIGKPFMQEGVVYRFGYVTTKRKSGNIDTVRVILNDEYNNKLANKIGQSVRIHGSVRSAYNTDGHLEVYVFPSRYIPKEEDREPECEFSNSILLSGIVAKVNTRKTQNGIRITDVLLKVTLSHARRLTIPCIFWNDLADTASKFVTGERIEFVGKLQSRDAKIDNVNGSILINEVSGFRLRTKKEKEDNV